MLEKNEQNIINTESVENQSTDNLSLEQNNSNLDENINYKETYLEFQQALKLANEQSLLTNEKLKQKELEIKDISEQNDKLRGRITLGEFKEKELAATINKLQLENAKLKKQIENLLSISTAITYTQDVPEAKDVTVLNPSKFSTSLPFCFPEKLPVLIRFKREIRDSMRGSLFVRQSTKAFPKIFTHQSNHYEKTMPHNSAFRSKMIFAKILSWNNIYKFSNIEKLKMPNISQLTFAQKYIKSKIAFAARFMRNSYAPSRLSTRNMSDKPLPLSFKMPEPPKLNPIKNSYELFMNYLSTTIIIDSSWHLAKKRVELLMKPVEEKTEKFLIKDIYFNETLAFRHRKSIQFTNRMTQKTEIKFEFIKESKLKNVLTSFGKTLDFMVKQFANTKTVKVDNNLEEL